MNVLFEYCLRKTWDLKSLNSWILKYSSHNPACDWCFTSCLCCSYPVKDLSLVLHPTKNNYLELRRKEFSLKSKSKCSVFMNDFSTEFVSKGKTVVPFSSPCPSGHVSFLFHFFIGAVEFGTAFSAITPGTMVLTPANRTDIKEDAEEHPEEGWEMEWRRTSLSKHMLGRWGREGLQPSWKEEVCVYFWCRCHTPCSVKAAGSFLGEERDRLFSGIKFPAAALRERRVSNRTASPIKPGILLEKRRSMLSPWNTGQAQSSYPHVTLLPFYPQHAFCKGDWSLQTC